MVITIISVILIFVLLFCLFTSLKKYKIIKAQFEDLSLSLKDIISNVDSVRYGKLNVRVEDNSVGINKELTDSINRMIETVNDRESMIVEYKEELLSKNKLLTTLINSLSDGLLLLDKNFVILESSKKIEEWLGIYKLKGLNAVEFIISTNGKKINKLSDDDIFLKGNKEFYFKATTKKLKSKEHGDKYLLMIKNYTNQKEIENLKEDFVATLTHDLKIPIIAEANMLDFFIDEKFGKLNKKQKDALTSMKESNQELLDLVQVVLDTYKIKEGEIDLSIKSVSVKKLLTDIISEMDSIAKKNQNNLVLNLRSDFNINIDKFQMKRVLKNLINNAILYGRKNTDIEINVKREWDNISISVKDYGKGIKKEDVAQIFNRYFSTSKSFRKVGTGLGLYLSHKIVKEHGGELIVQSEENNGSEFIIKLPV